MVEKDTKLIECSSFLEFSATANQIQTLQKICDHLLLTVMGRFGIARGTVAFADGSHFTRGKASDEPFAYEFPLTYADTELAKLCLGKRFTGKDLTSSETIFIEGLCSLTATFMKGISSRTELKDANRRLSKKILELNSLFELSRELLLLKSVDAAAALCLNEFSGQLMLRQMVIGIRKRGGSFRTYTRNVPAIGECETPNDALKRSGLSQVVSVEDKVFICAGVKLTGKPFDRSDREFAVILLNFLATTIDNIRMVEDLVEKEKLEREIRIARDIQQKLLPVDLPMLNGVSVCARMETYGEVGGDYYDMVRLDDHRLLFLVADVTGKGIPASLIMAAVQSSIRTLTSTSDCDLVHMAETLNRILCETTEGNKFVSMFLGIVNTTERSLHYLNAGHNHPVLFHKDRDSSETLSKGGMVLGLFDSAEFISEVLPFEPGNRLFLYTDGLTEITDAQGNEYGEEALYALLLSERAGSCGEILCKAVEASVRFGQQRLVDDVTALCIGFDAD